MWSRRRGLVTGVAAALTLGSLVGAIPAVGLSAPSVSAVSPTSGPTAGGTRVTVTGARYSQVKSVKFGTAPGKSIRVVSATKLRVTAPAHAAGTVDVRITTASGRSAIRNADHFTYVAPPAVSSVSPSKGRVTSGVRVTVTGAQFVHVKSVKFGTTPGTSVRVLSSSRVQVTAPAHAAGVVNVRVTTGYGTSAIRAADRYTYVAAPAVTSVSPVAGHATGGDRVTVKGARFTDVTAVTFGTVSGTAVHVTSSTQLEVTAPAHVAGVTDVRVTTKYGTSPVVNADKYTFSTLLWGTRAAVDPVHGYPAAVSCPTTTFCVLVDQYGSALTYNGTSWSAPLSIDGSNNLTAVSCSSPTFCVAVDDSGLAVRFNGTTWSAPVRIETPEYEYYGLTGVSCVSPTFCVAVGGESDAFTFNGTSWSAQTTVGGTHWLDAVSCVTPTFCAALDDWGNAVTFDGSGWSAAVNTGLSQGTKAVSCASGPICVAIDRYDAVIYDGAGWSAPTTIESAPFAWMASVSCASSSFCVAVDNEANAITYDGDSWSTPAGTGAGDYLSGVSCPSSSFCAAVGRHYEGLGYAITFNGTTWSAPASVDRFNGLVGVSCVSSSFCLAVGADGSAFAFDGTSWSTLPGFDPPGRPEALSCASPTFCLVVGNGDVLDGYYVKFNGASWSTPTTIAGSSWMHDVSCPTETFCMAVDDDNAITFNGSTWSAPDEIAASVYHHLSAVSCVAASFCFVVDKYDQGPPAWAYRSRGGPPGPRVRSPEAAWSCTTCRARPRRSALRTTPITSSPTEAAGGLRRRTSPA